MKSKLDSRFPGTPAFAYAPATLSATQPPLIGAGSGGFNQEKAQAILLSELETIESQIEATLTVFKR